MSAMSISCPVLTALQVRRPPGAERQAVRRGQQLQVQTRCGQGHPRVGPRRCGHARRRQAPALHPPCVRVRGARRAADDPAQLHPCLRRGGRARRVSTNTNTTGSSRSGGGGIRGGAAPVLPRRAVRARLAAPVALGAAGEQAASRTLTRIIMISQCRPLIARLRVNSGRNCRATTKTYRSLHQFDRMLHPPRARTDAPPSSLHSARLTAAAAAPACTPHVMPAAPPAGAATPAAAAAAAATGVPDMLTQSLQPTS